MQFSKNNLQTCESFTSCTYLAWDEIYLKTLAQYKRSIFVYLFFKKCDTNRTDCLIKISQQSGYHSTRSIGHQQRRTVGCFLLKNDSWRSKTMLLYDIRYNTNYTQPSVDNIDIGQTKPLKSLRAISIITQKPPK